MSNEERFEMTKNIDIDLESIPHPKDCYRVPVGATIPACTPCWEVDSDGRFIWNKDGYRVSVYIMESGFPRFTPEPIIPRPAPEDSPIIINRCQQRGALGALLKGLAVWTEDGEWLLVNDAGRDFWLDGNEITDWSPAIVTKSGHGIWDERDKRDRVDVDGDTWRWHDDRAVWVCHAINTAKMGSLNALSMYYGSDYLTGFADDEGGEE